MLLSLDTVQANVRNRDGRRVFFLGRGDQLTSQARDYLNRERIAILPAEKAGISEYRLLNGAVLRDKPEHMTHLSGNILVPKTHPRIVFRGKLDTLEAELILCQLYVPEFRSRLGEILDLARDLMGREVMEEPAQVGTLCGLTEEAMRQRSHNPQTFYGQPHFMPACTDGPAVVWLNRCRCAAREAELAGVAAFVDPDGQTQRSDLLQALNRMSSMLYLLMVEAKSTAGK